jgi:hypothetical protein
VGAHASSEGAEQVRLFDAVVEQSQTRAVRLDRELAQGVAVERRQQQVAHADVQLNGFQIGHALRGVRDRLFRD